MSMVTIARPVVAAEFVCGNCGADWHPHASRGWCRPCYDYWLRHRTLRPATLYAPSRALACANCTTPIPHGIGFRCRACAVYRWRTGRERPQHLWGRRRSA